MWSCDRCTLKNDEVADECDACGQKRPASSRETKPTSSTDVDPSAWVPVGQPKCHYGPNCKRQNPQHFKDEGHPPSHAKVLEYKIVSVPGPEHKGNADARSASPPAKDSSTLVSAAPISSLADTASSSAAAVSSPEAAPKATSSEPSPAPVAAPAAKKAKAYDIRSFFTPSSSPSKPASDAAGAGRKLPVWAKDDGKGNDKEDRHRKKPKTEPASSSSHVPAAASARSPAASPPLSPPKGGALIYIGARGSGGGASSGWDETKKGFLEMLAALERSEKDKGDRMRAKAYGMAMNALRDHQSELKSGAEAMKLKGVGKKIAAKFDEFLASGSVARVDRDRADPRTAALAALTSVNGVGPVLAKELLDGPHGIDSVAALRTAVEGGRVTVSHAVKIGLKYHEQLVQRIPRAEVDELREVVEKAARGLDEKILVEVLGSYRRGAKTSGDIDCLITHPQYTRQAGAGRFNFVTQLVAALRREGFLVDDLTSGEIKYMGVCKVPGTADALARRIDIMSIVQEEWACAVTYFTGSGAFNRKMRVHALERGYTLNEHALCHWDAATKTKGAAVPVPDEISLFSLLGLEWVPPAERELGK